MSRDATFARDGPTGKPSWLSEPHNFGEPDPSNYTATTIEAEKRVIDVQRVGKTFGQFRAVDALSFSVGEGEILGFLGPNGAGKTTTMRVLTGFIPPSEGTAIIAGHDIVQEPLEAKRLIGYLPETPPLYPEMKVVDYLDFVARLKGIVDGKQRRSRVESAIERCALTEMTERLTSHLSKGYRQRVGIAQAIVHDPKVLILDEPTAGLDPKQITETRALIRDLSGEHTIVLSTHILPEVSMTCQRVVILNRGKLVAEDSPEGLTARLLGKSAVSVRLRNPTERLEDTLGRLDFVQSWESADEGATIHLSITPSGDEDIRPHLARALVESGEELVELNETRLSLEDVFLELTTEESDEGREAPEQPVDAEQAVQAHQAETAHVEDGTPSDPREEP